MAEPGALGGALDQAGDVGQHDLAVVELDRAQHRLQRRERIVGDLRIRPRQPRQQRGLAGVGKPDQPDVGEQLQPQLDPTRLACQPALGEARGLPRGGGEPLVPVPPAPAPRHDDPLPVCQQLGHRALEPGNGGPRRNRHDPILPPLPVLAAPLPMSAPPGPEVLASPQRRQIAPPGLADQHDVATAPTVAPVGPALGHVGFPAKGDDAVAAAPALDIDLGLVVKHGPTLAPTSRNGSPAGPGAVRDMNPGATRRRRPRRCARAARCRTRTTPGRLAKIVWSRPRPTPSPGRKRVPRWRTMISPPATVWPEKTLTPRNLGLESRPLRLEPSPFL